MFACSNRCVSTRHAALAAFAIALCFVGRATADVISIGSVNPIPPLSGGTSTLAWAIGDDQATNQDLRGWVNISGGTTLQYATLIVGDEETFVGQLNVVGNFLASQFTKLTLSDFGNGSNNPSVQIGRQGTGTLNVSGGATMVLASQLADMSIGDRTTGVGYATITDPFTMLTIGEDLIVGSLGTGRLDVLNGATVTTLATGSARTITIGKGTTGGGTVVVDGTGSLLRAGSNLVVGGAGVGSLTISNHAIVDVDNVTTATVTVGPLGQLHLAGGTLVGQTPTTGFGINVNGFLGGSGLVRGSVSFADVSTSTVGPGQVLQFNGIVANQGGMTIDHGEVQFLDVISNKSQGATTAPGRIVLEDGTLRFSPSLISTNNGVIATTHGSSNIHGRLVNSGQIVVASDTVATFYDGVTNLGGTVQVLPRGNALFLANLTFTSAAALQLGVSMSNLTDASARLGAAGAVALGGALTVTVEGSFTPTLGQTFDLITANNGVSGTFNTITIPDLAGPLEYGVIYNPNSVQLIVRPDGSGSAVPGDYNGDAVIDIADYTVWRDTLGRTGTGLAADGNHDNKVDSLDYDLWKGNFGFGAGGGATSGLASHAGTPEPASLVLCGLGLTLLLSGRRFHRTLVAWQI